MHSIPRLVSRICGVTVLLSLAGCQYIEYCMMHHRASAEVRAEIARRTHAFSISGRVVDERGTPVEHCQMQVTARKLSRSWFIFPGISEGDAVSLTEIDGSFSVCADAAMVFLQFGRDGYFDSTVLIVAVVSDSRAPKTGSDSRPLCSPADATYVGATHADLRIVLRAHRPHPVRTFAGVLEYRNDGSVLAAKLDDGPVPAFTFGHDIVQTEAGEAAAYIYLDRTPPRDGVIYAWTDPAFPSSSPVSEVCGQPRFLHVPGDVIVVEASQAPDSLADMRAAPMISPRLPPLHWDDARVRREVSDSIFLNQRTLVQLPGGDQRAFFYFRIASHYGRGLLTLHPPESGMARASIVLQVQDDGSRWFGAADQQ